MCIDTKKCCAMCGVGCEDDIPSKKITERCGTTILKDNSDRDDPCEGCPAIEDCEGGCDEKKFEDPLGIIVVKP